MEKYLKLPKFGKRQKSSEIEEAEQTPNKLNPKQFTPGYIRIRLLKTKNTEKNLKAARGKTI